MAEDNDELISRANRAIATARWRKTSLRNRLMQGQILKMGRLRKRGYLLCAVCNKGMTRDKEGNYIHCTKALDKQHPALP